MKECARCGHVLVDEDDAGWYYQVPFTDPEIPGLTFMDRVHECDGKPHDVRLRSQPEAAKPVYACCGHCQHDDAIPQSLPPHETPCQPEDGLCAKGSTVARG